MKRILILLSLVALLAGTALADEGMWLFNAFPKAKVKAKYSFEPSQEWLDHVRLASVRFSNGSGSFVSEDGLVFTNHHIGARCVQELSTGGKDYMKTGFMARTQAEEARCPDMELNVLMSMEDVTQKVQAATKPDMTTAQTGQAQRAAMSAIEKDCTASTGLRCDVVTLYSGGMYHLYRYKKYTDVRLVFAPEFDMAFFGGDPDNFTYPRYDLDITFFRVYESGKPVHVEHFLKWAKTGVKEGDLIFVPGNPGSTGRLLTMAQLEFLRDVDYAWRLKVYPQRIKDLKEFAAQSAENARIAQEPIFGLENSLKAYTGYNSGLADKSLMAGKAAEEKNLRAAVEADAKKKAEFGGAWQEIDQAMALHKQIFLPYNYVERRSGFRGTMAKYARDLVRLAAEKPNPNGERLREYRDSALASLEQELFSTAPVYKTLETRQLTASLTEMRDHLGVSNPAVKLALNGKTPAEAAKAIITGTKLDDVAFRKQLYQGGEAAIQASADPLIDLMKRVDAEARTLRKQYDDQVDAVERRDGARLAKLRFAERGLNEPPDATFTLRLSYGAVKSYQEEGKYVACSTKMAEAFQHAEKHGNTPPYKLPESWMASRSKVKPDAHLNFVSTADIIGGNSGSPVINKDAEIVGIIFDGNIQSLPWRFAFEDKIGRAVSVDAQGVQEALRSIYGATTLADELTGTLKPKTGAPTGK